MTLFTPNPTPELPEPETGVEADGVATEVDDVEEEEEEDTPVTMKPPPMAEDDDAVIDSSAEVEVVMTDGLPETGARLDPGLLETAELADEMGVTVAEALVSVTDAAILLWKTLDSSRPVEVEFAGAATGAESFPLPARPECAGLLHFLPPCPAA